MTAVATHTQLDGTEVTEQGDEEHLFQVSVALPGSSWQEGEPMMAFIGWRPTTFFCRSRMLEKLKTLAAKEGYQLFVVVFLNTLRNDRYTPEYQQTPWSTRKVGSDLEEVLANPDIELIVPIWGPIAELPPDLDFTSPHIGKVQSYGNAKNPYRVPLKTLELRPWPDEEVYLPEGLKTEEIKDLEERIAKTETKLERLKLRLTAAIEGLMSAGDEETHE